MTLYKIQMEEETLKETMEEFMAFKKAQQRDERTLKDYQTYLDDFLAKSQNSMDYETLTADIVDYFAKIPLTSPSRYNHPYEYLNSFLNWAIRNDKLSKNPLKVQGLTKIKDEGNIKSVKIEDIKRLLKSLDKTTFAGLRDYVMILLMLDTGIRTSELRRLKDGDFTPSANQIFISKEISKTKRSRILYLSNETAKALVKYIRVKPEGFSEYIFPTRDGNQMTRERLSREFDTICKRIGIKFTAYQLRHTFATYFVENGGDVFTLQELMGHSDLRMTKRYTDISDTRKEQQHKKFTPLNALQGANRLVKI